MLVKKNYAIRKLNWQLFIFWSMFWGAMTQVAKAPALWLSSKHGEPHSKHRHPSKKNTFGYVATSILHILKFGLSYETPSNHLHQTDRFQRVCLDQGSERRAFCAHDTGLHRVPDTLHWPSGHTHTLNNIDMLIASVGIVYWTKPWSCPP